MKRWFFSLLKSNLFEKTTQEIQNTPTDKHILLNQKRVFGSWGTTAATTATTIIISEIITKSTTGQEQL